jgi:hypothetical protein
MKPLSIFLSYLPVFNTFLQTLLADLSENINTQPGWEIIPMMSIQGCDFLKYLLRKFKI